LSIAFVRASRLNPWKTKPSFWFRRSASAFRLRPFTFVSSSTYVPEVGTSRQPRMFIRVDLPEPDEPMIAIISPAFTVRSTPFSAATSLLPMR
jgi:hypothetical protein